MRGLLIREPWISKILAGIKTLEMRPMATRIRGEVALIRGGSGLVVGTANLIDSLPPLKPDNYMGYVDRHSVPPEMLSEVITRRWFHPWVLADVHRLATPVPYKHGSGPVTFVILDASVSDAIRRQTGSSHDDAVREPHRANASHQRPLIGRVDVPEPAVKSSTSLPRKEELPRRDDHAPVFVFRAEVAQAYGFPVAGGGFVVQKDSTAMREGSPRKKRDRPLRDDLVRRGVLVPHMDGRLYRFSHDHEFSSASAAAGVIKDGNASGPSLWKDEKTGRSLKDYRGR
jgi:hypothetical protein